MKLDRSREFQQVLGSENVAYEQNGKLFDRSGNEVAPVDLIHFFPPEDPKDIVEEPYSGSVTISGQEEEEEAPPLPPQGSDLTAMHWRHLKAMVEIGGGTWTDKAAAIEFLRHGAPVAA